MKTILSFLRKIFSKINKYYLTGAIFLVITFLVGDSTIFRRIARDRQIRELEANIDVEKNKKKIAERGFEALKSDKDSLERIAREKYLMTKPNEELFLINER